jgi:polyketide synthase PksN
LPGELLIAGNGLADGYHERPELTAKKFVASAIEEERGLVYRTGDLVRYLPDGRLEHLRRIDQQVKIDGRRVELGEIEQMLRTEERVRDAAVIVREDGRRPRLVAYVAGAGPVDAGRLRRRLAERLPAYMVPHELVLLDALPLTPNGKIDRKALPAPAQSASPGAQPRSESERAVAAAWCAVLERDAVGIDDNFFDLGGTSLLLPPLVARLRELAPRTGIVEVFQHPTVRTMAQWLGRGDADPGARAPASRAARDRTALERRRFERVRNHEDDSGEELYAGVPVVPHRK